MAFDPDDVIGFAARYRVRLSAETIGYGLGIGRRAVQEISACSHMSASGLSLRDDEVWFSDDDISNFVTRLHAAKRPSVEDPIRLKDALLAIHGRAKPWGAIVGEMLAGDLPFMIASGTRKMTDRISLERRASALNSNLVSAPASGKPLADRVTQREALKMLNAKITCRALDGLKSAGVNPITYALDDVVERARSGTSVLEIAARIGRPLSFAYHAIKRARVETVAHGLWDRGQVLSIVATFDA